MIRVAGLQRQLTEGVIEPPPDGLSPVRQLAEIRAALAPLIESAHRCWHEDLLVCLERAGIGVRRVGELPVESQARMRRLFEEEIFPALTPLAFDTSHPFPFISNLSLNLAITVRDTGRGERFARLKVPVGVFPRLIEVPPAAAADRREFVFLEDLIASNVDLLFPGLAVVAVHPFRVTRNADIEIEEDEADDLLTAIEESVELRRHGSPVRIEVDSSIPEDRCALFMRQTRHRARHDLPRGGADRARGPDAARPAPDSRAPRSAVSPCRPAGARPGTGHLRRDPEGRHPPLPPVRLVRARGLVPAAGRPRPGRARDQGHALPCRSELPGRGRAHGGARARQAGDGRDRAQGSLRRGEQHRVGAGAGAGGGARGLRPAPHEGPRQGLHGRPPRGAGPGPVPSPRHGQLQRLDRPGVHGPRALHLQAVLRGGRLRPLQLPDRARADRRLPRAPGRAGDHPLGHPRPDRA